MSNNLLNNVLNTTEEESDDEEDIDYKPEADVLSAESGSEGEGEDGIEADGLSSRKGKHKKTAEEVTETEDKPKEELSEDQFKQKADSLWDEFCKDLPKNSETKSLDNESIKSTGVSTVTKTYEFAGQEVSVTEEVANSSKADKSSENNGNISAKSTAFPPKPFKRTGGLGSIVDQLKKPKLTTLTKSAIDWNNYKKDEGIEDELKQHNKSRDTFTERQAFLQRTDLRQFEIEREIREKNRNRREISKD